MDSECMQIVHDTLIKLHI